MLPHTLKYLALTLSLSLLYHYAVGQDQPNIVFIMADDHATKAIGAYKSELSELNPTPILDSLADESILFENCFVTNSICTPSRASIMTGQYSQTNGVLDLWNDLETSQHYLPQEIKKLGYETAMIGKWHLHKEPIHFDHYSVLPSQGKYFDPEFREKGKGNWPDNIITSTGHSSDVITNKAMEWIDKRGHSEKPFFLMYHFKAPHDMFEYNPKYDTYLQDEFIPEPASLYDQSTWGSIATKGENEQLQSSIGSSVSTRHTNRNYVDYYKTANDDSNEATSNAYQTYLKHYLRCVKGIDDNLGRFFQYLKQNGLWDNTIIVYTSDQGMILGEHDLTDKRWMYEESIHMPLIIRRPGDSPRRVTNLINNTDFAPTLIELAGGRTPEYMQGHSTVSLLKGAKPTDWRKSTYYRYWMHMIHHDIPAHFGLRTEKYKLIFFYGRHHDLEKEGTLSMYWNDEANSNKVTPTPVAWEFYDLTNDPDEQVNQYGNPEYKYIIDSLKMDLAEKRRDLGEEDTNFPHLQKIIDTNWNL